MIGEADNGDNKETSINFKEILALNANDVISVKAKNDGYPTSGTIKINENDYYSNIIVTKIK